MGENTNDGLATSGGMPTLVPSRSPTSTSAKTDIHTFRTEKTAKVRLEPELPYFAV